MNFNVKFTEEELETRLIKVLLQTYDVKILARQFKIVGGIIDILAKSTNHNNVYFVIEIQKGDITPDAVCQVLRYTQFLNNEMSKNGKRKFYPLLIGSSISYEQSNGHLFKLLTHFSNDINDNFYCMYDLFKIGVYGVKLGFYDYCNQKFLDYAYNKQFDYKNAEIEKLIDNCCVQLRQIEAIVEYAKNNLSSLQLEQIEKIIKKD